MLENFREIYNAEISKGDYSPLEALILESTELRMFVYEVCKECIVSQQAVQAEKTSWTK